MNFLRRSLGATFNAPRNWISAGVLAIASWTTPCRAAGSDAAPFDDLEYLAAVECPTRDGLLVRLRQAVRAAPTPSHQWGKLKLTIARPSSPSGNYEGSLRLNEDLPRLLKGSACGEIVNAVIVIVKIWAREATLPSKVAVVELRSLGVAAEKSGTQITATDSPVLQPKGAATEQLPASPTSASPRRHENRGTRLKMAVVAPHQTKRRSPDEFAHQTNGSSLANEFAHQTNGSSLANEFAHQTNGSSLADEFAHQTNGSSLANEAPSDSPLWSLESGASARFGVAPGISIGALGRLGVALGTRSPWSFRLGFARSSTGTVDVSPAAVWSHLLLASAGSCFRIGSMTRSILRSCVEFEVGSFEAGAEPNASITRTTRIARPWLSAGLSVRAEFSVLRPHLGLWFETGAAVPIVREQLIFSAPEVPVHRTWLVTPWMQFGIKVTLGGSNPATPGTAQ